jgi:hypothetical protein
MKYSLSQIDRSHGRSNLRFKDNKRTIMVDESWFYPTSDAITVMLIEDMDVLISPKVQHNSPDLNINDLGFFASLKADVKRICTHCTSREEMMANVMKAFEEYPKEKIDGIWACWFNNLRSLMSYRGENDYKQAHNGGKWRQTETGSACDYTVNLDDYDRCVRLCRQ